MPAQDIMPFAGSSHGQPRVHSFRMGGGTTDTTENTSWEVGYILTLDGAAGDINPEIDGAVVPVLGSTFIAGASSANLIQLFNATSGAATHGLLVPTWEVNDGTEFETLNIVSGNDTQLAPTPGNSVFVGATADLWVDDVVTTMVGHIHGLDLGGDGLVITRITDNQGNDVGLEQTGTPTRMVFKVQDIA